MLKIKLHYKEYKAKITLNACKSFYDATKLDLQIVLADYIACSLDNTEQSLIARLSTLGNLHSRDIVCEALYAMISEGQDGISLEELQDATFNAGWQPTNEDPKGFCQPYPVVMLQLAYNYNAYFNNNLAGKKKVSTS